MEDLSQYLELAQLSQEVIRSILHYLEEGQWEPFQATISNISGPLQAFMAEDAAPVKTTAFAGYEKINTLSEAWDTQQTEQVIERMKKLLAVADGPEAKREAEALIAPFQKLSTQALWNFEQPQAGLPHGIFELCKAH